MLDINNDCAINQGKKYFCKYVTADTVCKILTNLTVKWSSPLIFNDPFDMQTEVIFDFSEEEQIKHVVDEIIRLGCIDRDEVLEDGCIGIPAIEDLRTKTIDIDLFRNDFQESFKQLFLPRLREHIELHNKWQRTFVKKVRVFCVVEEHDNLLMWAHYSKNHTGAVIKFRLIPELNTALCGALPIQYSSKPPTFANMEEYIQDITGKKSIDTYNSSLMYTLTKSNHWQYEKEWRCAKTSTSTDLRKRSEFVPFFPDEIDTVYLGLKMKRKNEDAIIRCRTGPLKNVQVYKAKKSKTKFGLDFERIR